jgi:D-alanine-D-alanine ligase
MKICIVYNLKEDYGFDAEHINYYDFTYLTEAENVRKNLELAGHYVVLISSLELFLTTIKQDVKAFDLVFNMYEGFKSRNREGLVPAICESYNIPYTFSDAFSSSFSLHKFHTNCFLKKLGVKVPKGFLLSVDNFDKIAKKIKFPIVLKPNTEGSSTGLKLVKNKSEFINSVNVIGKTFGRDILVEEYIDGLELSVCVLGTGEDAYVFSLGQYVDLNYDDILLFNHETKRRDMHHIIKPKLSKNILDEIRKDSLKIHRALNFYDISRIDWRVRDGKGVFLEATPLPDFAPNSEFEWGAKQQGLTFSFVLTSIVASALKRHNLKL